MTLPAPTTEYTDSEGMQSSDWTQGGTPTFSPDQHNPSDDVAFEGDNVNNRLQQSALLTSSDSDKHTISFWFQTSAVPAGQNDIMLAQTELASASERGFFINMAPPEAGGSITVKFGGAGISLQSVLNNDRDFEDNLWHHFITSVNGTTPNIDIRIDSKDDTGTYTTKNDVGGTGYVGQPNPVKDLTVGCDTVPTNFANTGFKMSRLKIWNTTAATAEEMVEEYNAEIALLETSTTSPLFTDMPMANLFPNMPFNMGLFKNT